MKKGWQTKKLSEVCLVERGSSPRPIKEFFTTNPDGVNWIKIGDTEEGGRYVYSTAQKITPEGAKQSRFVKEGDFILTNSMSFGRPYIMKTTGYIHDGWFVLRLKEFIDTDYFYHLLSSDVVQSQFRQLASGAIVQNISGDLVKMAILPIPPLAEQQRIVGLLDEAFEGLSTAKANAEKNLQNARALFESHLQFVFTQRGSGWVETTLARATDGIFTGPFGSLVHKSDYVANGVPLVNPAHITEVGIEPDMRKTVSKSTALRLKNYIMSEGDIVIGRRGEMGRCALVTEIENGWLCGTGSFFIKPSSRCDTRYLVRFLRSENCKARLEKIAGGAVMPNLSNTDLGNLTFDLPPLGQQKAIVEEIDQLHEETQRLSRIYEQKLAALESLKKALLHQAFAGEL